MSNITTEIYLLGSLLFISCFIISYNIAKCCIKHYIKHDRNVMLNNEYKKLHSKLYNYKYYNVQNDNNNNHDSLK